MMIRIRLASIASSIVIALGLLNCSFAANKSVTCYIQINKPPAWANYTVTVKMYDFSTQKVITSYVLPKKTGTSASVNSLKKTFDCQKYPQLTFGALFWPPIWQNMANTEYPSNLHVDLTSQLITAPKGDSDLTITVNFPNDFISVPALLGNVN